MSCIININECLNENYEENYECANGYTNGYNECANVECANGYTNGYNECANVECVNEYDDCCICLDTCLDTTLDVEGVFFKSEFVLKCCNNTIHKKCLFDILIHGYESCPLCRRYIDIKNYKDFVLSFNKNDKIFNSESMTDIVYENSLNKCWFYFRYYKYHIKNTSIRELFTINYDMKDIFLIIYGLCVFIYLIRH